MLKFVAKKNPIHKVNPLLRKGLKNAQSELFCEAYTNAWEFLTQALEDTKVSARLPNKLKDMSCSDITNLTFLQLIQLWSDLLRNSGFDSHTIPHHAANLAQQTQLIEAFSKPTEALSEIRSKISRVVESFPRKANDIECGRNPGDVLDPYILAATQFLMCGGNFEQAIGHTVAHKALMMIEGLLGHLHEDVLGMMRGNVRSPEPRGKDQETLDPRENPFPGADLIQPPWSKERGLRFHQIKSKTGSAKGGDGRRLGEQLQRLQDTYGGDIFYHALIGNTLKGHRSKAGVEKAAKKVVVLVGEASFAELTGCNHGPQLLLRVYQAAFQDVAISSGYKVETMATAITETFLSRAESAGDGFLDIILKTATGGSTSAQDSRLYNRADP
ncbi:MAG: hypothetical protein NUW37_16800 [Planctomycetes bacterium]|nr:hypothetical protein [Planctomycetota bacterium]